MLPEKKARREVEIKLQNDLIRMGSIKTCTNCEYWVKERTIIVGESKTDVTLCGKYNMIPPLTVCLTGCVEHEDAIPF